MRTACVLCVACATYRSPLPPPRSCPAARQHASRQQGAGPTHRSRRGAPSGSRRGCRSVDCFDWLPRQVSSIRVHACCACLLRPNTCMPPPTPTPPPPTHTPHTHTHTHTHALHAEAALQRKRCAAYLARRGGTAALPHSASGMLPAQQAVATGSLPGTPGEAIPAGDVPADESLRKQGPQKFEKGGAKLQLVAAAGAPDGRPYAVELFGLRKVFKVGDHSQHWAGMVDLQQQGCKAVLIVAGQGGRCSHQTRRYSQTQHKMLLT